MKRLGFDAACCSLLLVLGLLIALPIYCNGIDLGDEGMLAYNAIRVMEGQIPYRDFFSLQPPLSFYTTAVCFKLLGTTLVALRSFGLLLYLSIPLLIFAISRYFARPVLALGAALPALVLGLPFFNFVPFAVWQGMAATLIAALLYILALEKARPSWAFYSGLVTAVAVLARHDQGLYLIASICIFTLAHKLVVPDNSKILRLYFLWIVGWLAPMLLILISWALSGTLLEAIKQLVLFPLTVYPRTSSIPMPLFNLDQPISIKILVSSFYLPLFCYGATVIWLLTRIYKKALTQVEVRLLFVLVLALLFYCQVLARSDLWHLLITLPPFFIILAYWLQAFTNTINMRLNRTTAITLAILIIVIIYFPFWSYAGPFFLPHRSASFRVINLPRAGVRVNSPMASRIERIKRLIENHTGPNEALLCLPYQPMFYFIYNRRNPTQWNYLWPGDQSPKEHEELIKQSVIAATRLAIIVGAEEMNTYAPSIIRYLENDYSRIFEQGKTTVYLNKHAGRNNLHY